MKLFKHLLCYVFILITHVSFGQKDRTLHNKRVLILGNSITQNGRYVDFVEYYLLKNYPNEKLDIISIGLSSETISGASEVGRPFLRPGLHTRLDSALILTKPDLVIAIYGMNDGLFSNFDPIKFEGYKEGVFKLISKVKQAGSKLMLITPTVFDPDPIMNRVSKKGEPHYYEKPYVNYNKVLDTFSNWLMTLKTKELPIIDLHSYMNSVIKEAKKIKRDSTLTPDGVHPNDLGHYLMAKKILMDLYPEIKLKEPNKEWTTLKSNPLFLLVAKRRLTSSNGWLAYVGYTREKSVKTYNIKPTLEKLADLDKEIAGHLESVKK